MRHYSSHIIIHERTQRLMKDIQNEEVDVDLLCDALEYLANDHSPKTHLRYPLTIDVRVISIKQLGC